MAYHNTFFPFVGTRVPRYRCDDVRLAVFCRLVAFFNCYVDIVLGECLLEIEMSGLHICGFVLTLHYIIITCGLLWRNFSVFSIVLLVLTDFSSVS